MKSRLPSIPVISLFCGAGGLDTGFLQAGFVPIIAVDASTAACQTYEKNHPGVTVLAADLGELTAESIAQSIHDRADGCSPLGVIGGPPCQAFSRSNGYKKANDPRAKLSERYASLLGDLNELFNLDFFVFENVLGLRHVQHLEQFNKFKRMFAGAGFTIFEGELDAKDFGVPQTRKRVFIVGLNSKKYPQAEFYFPSATEATPLTVRDAIGGLPAPAYFRRGIRVDEIPFHPNHWCMKPQSSKFFDGSLEEGTIKGRPFRVLHWDRPSWTVAYGNREVHVHPTGLRRLSVYEAMRLQGFPKRYELRGTLSDQIRMVSDSVPPPLAHALSLSLRDALTVQKRIGRRRSKNIALAIVCRSREISASVAVPDILNGFFSRFAKAHIRQLPWRRSNVTPFQLLVAEMLLKQTKASDVARIWPTFIRRYPTAKRLSAAPLSPLVRQLHTLGFQNQRATLLLRMAKYLQRQYSGQIPVTVRQLASIPGVGAYCATAVLSFALKKRLPIVDANVMRVYKRLTGDTPGRDLRRSETVWAWAWSLLPTRDSHIHNYGLLDFADSICSRVPKCGECTLRTECSYSKLTEAGTK